MDADLEFMKFRTMRFFNSGEYELKKDNLGFYRYTLLPMPDDAAALGEQPTPTPEIAIKKGIAAATAPVDTAVKFTSDLLRSGVNKLNDKTFSLLADRFAAAGVDPKISKKILKSTAGEVSNFAMDIFFPRNTFDVALGTAFGPLSKPARKVAGAAAGTLLTSGLAIPDEQVVAPELTTTDKPLINEAQ
jgi:hypothetical protein